MASVWDCCVANVRLDRGIPQPVELLRGRARDRRHGCDRRRGLALGVGEREARPERGPTTSPTLSSAITVAFRIRGMSCDGIRNVRERSHMQTSPRTLLGPLF